MKRLYLVGLIALTTLLSCYSYQAPVFKPSSAEALKASYSCEWRCIIEGTGKWQGDFGDTQTRTLRGIGPASVCLPDGDGMKYAGVMLVDTQGQITVQIVGPGYEGDKLTTDVTYGNVMVMANETEEQRQIYQETRKDLQDILK